MTSPAANWQEAADKARYLLALFDAASSAATPVKTLIVAVVADFDRLAEEG